MVKIIVIFIILFCVGGFSLVGEALNIWKEVFVGFFPFFYEVGKMAIEDYLTSPYFIVGVILALMSAVGIWVGAKGGKVLYLIVSIIVEVISLASIFGNIL